MTTIQTTLKKAAAACLLLLFTIQFSHAAQLVVTSNLDDASIGTLRSQIGAASAGDTIVFSTAVQAQNIELNSAIFINIPLNIFGSTENKQSISLNSSYNGGFIAVYNTLNLRNISFSAPQPISYGLFLFGNAIITNCEFTSIVISAPAGFPFENGLIVNAAICEIRNSIFRNNTFVDGPNGGATVYNSDIGSMHIEQCLFQNNTNFLNTGQSILNEGFLNCFFSTFVNHDLGGGGIIHIPAGSQGADIIGNVFGENSILEIDFTFTAYPIFIGNNVLEDAGLNGATGVTFLDNQIGEASFIDPSTNDFRLQEFSLGENGFSNYLNINFLDQEDLDNDGNTAELVDVDLNGNRRFDGLAQDFGAFESSNDECRFANFIDYELTGRCETVSFNVDSTTQATYNDVLPSCDAYGGPWTDVWYKFYSPSARGVRLFLNSITGGPGISFEILDGCYEGGNSPTVFGCGILGGAGGYAGEADILLPPPVDIPTTRYIRFFTNEGYDLPGTFEFCLETLAPPNDLCIGATPLTCGVPVEGRFLYATADTNPQLDCDDGYAYFPNYEGVWYSFTGTGDVMHLNTCSDVFLADTDLHLYEGDCNNLSCISSEFISCDNDQAKLTFNTNAGQTYWAYINSAIGVNAIIANEDFSIFEIELTCGSPCQDNILISNTSNMAEEYFAIENIEFNLDNAVTSGQNVSMYAGDTISIPQYSDLSIDANSNFSLEIFDCSLVPVEEAPNNDPELKTNKTTTID